MWYHFYYFLGGLSGGNVHVILLGFFVVVVLIKKIISRQYVPDVVHRANKCIFAHGIFPTITLEFFRGAHHVLLPFS
jgi:hypothetical protein